MVAVSSIPISRIAANSLVIMIEGFPDSNSQVYSCVVPMRSASSL